MELVYIFHSGFALLGDGFTVVMDYYMDSKEYGDDGVPHSGILHDEILQREGKFYVLSSHFHPDHFNKEVLTWREKRPDIIYILSKDILKHRRAKEEDALWLRKGEEYKDEIIKINAFGSTDVGVSFLIEVQGKKIFHAGDLNNWHWMDESDEVEWKRNEKYFLYQLDYIYRQVKEMDVVMFPVDPRLGNEYMRGATQFIDKIKTRTFVPMHFTPEYDKANAFGKIAQEKGVEFIPVTHNGQIIKL